MKMASQNNKRKKALHKAKQSGAIKARSASRQAPYFPDQSPSQSSIYKEREEYKKSMARLLLKGLSEVFKITGDVKSNNEDWRNQLRLEAVTKNLYAEIAGLINSGSTSPFSTGRKALFLAVGELIEYGDQCPDDLRQRIRHAGELLNESGGFTDMRDLLVWSFIPNPLHEKINLIWHGIGDWRA